MRIPLDSNFTELPNIFNFHSEVEWARGRPVFTGAWTGAYGDSYFDLGTSRPCIYSAAYGATAMAWIWSPGTSCPTAIADKAVSSANMYLGVNSLNASFTEQNDTGITLSRRTRADVCWGTGSPLAAYINGANVEIRTVPTLPAITLGSVTASFAHGISDTTGASVSIISATEVWVGYIENGIHRAKRWDGTTVTSFVLSYSKDYDWWHSTYFRAEKLGTNTILMFMKTAKLAATRTVIGLTIGEMSPIIGSSDEYAFQSTMVTGSSVATVDGHPRIFAILSRSIEDPDGEVAVRFSSIAYTDNGTDWTDWSAIPHRDFRGSIGVVGDSIYALAESKINVSNGTVVTGNATWDTLDGVASWNMSSRIDSATTCGTQVNMSASGQWFPMPGDMIRRNGTMNSVKFRMSTESVDSAPVRTSQSGSMSAIASRGPLKNGLVYQSPVDELFQSGMVRSLDFKYNSVVSISGVWTHDEMSKEMTVDDDLEADAIAVFPDPLSGDMMFISSAVEATEGCGPVFFFEVASNFFRLNRIGSNHVLERYQNGHLSTLATFASLSGQKPSIMVRFALGVIYFYSSTDLTPSAGLEKYTFGWKIIGSYNITEAPPTSYKVGFSGKTGTKISYMGVRVNGIAQTIASVVNSMAIRSGMKMSIQDIFSGYPSWTNTASIGQIGGYVDAVDVRFDMDVSGGKFIDIYLGQKGHESGSDVWSVLLRIETASVTLIKTDGDETVFRQEGFNLLPGYRMRVFVGRTDDGDHAISVYRNDLLICHIPIHYPTLTGGNVGFGGSGKFRNLVIPKMSYPLGDFVWQYRRTAADGIRELIAPFLWSIYENTDFTVSVGPTDESRGIVGDVDMILEMVNHVADDSYNPITKVVGGETYGVYVDQDELHRGIRVSEFDNPYLYDAQSCIEQAARMSRYAKRASTKKMGTGLPDLRVEVGDQVSIDGDDYIVEEYNLVMGSLRSPGNSFTISGRQK